jgi:hypothetical protein
MDNLPVVCLLPEQVRISSVYSFKVNYQKLDSTLISFSFFSFFLFFFPGGVLSSMLAESVLQVLVSGPDLVTRHTSLVTRHLPDLDLDTLLQLAAILDPSQGAVRGLVRGQASSLHR